MLRRVNLAKCFDYAPRAVLVDDSTRVPCGGSIAQCRAFSTVDTLREVIFSGIQPTGVPHLGNYLGALQKWVQYQDEATDGAKLIYSLVDLHAITVQQEPTQLRIWRRESLAMLMAIGLDPKRSIIFHQSDVPAHSELMWILSCQASTGYLNRMTQWKDKTQDEKKDSPKLRLGLFSYPVLQAADILLYQSTSVPVGEDQAQHLEFTRHLAQGFNSAYGQNIFTVPRITISHAKRIRSLSNVGKKMSKSDKDPKSRIMLTDSEDEIKAKFKAAVTDSMPGIEYRPYARAGVSNLVQIIYYGSKGACDDPHDEAKAELAKSMARMSLRALKEKAAEVTDALIRPIRERYAELLANEKLLDDVAAEGAEKARQHAAPTLAKVKETVGLS